MKKKIISLLLCTALTAAMLSGCGGQSKETTEEPATEDVAQETPDSELPTITFTHGYYHDESEWPAAAEMRAIYQEFADAHKD